MNIVQLLEEREQCDVRTKRVMECALEDSFIAGNAEQFDIAMPRSVSSTIAIAMSCNGMTFATTHGDHTVKVFDFGSGEQIRNFSGHPRTPWTLKYHPTDPNIIASGCLGFQVRVWDIKENACVNMIILNQTIISLAFHPAGEYIAVVCGMRIDLWEWRVPLACHEEVPQLPSNTPFALTSKYLRHSPDLENEEYDECDEEDEESPLTRSITHKRNIRAVIFHPSGDYIFAVAPDAPKQNNEELSHCKLYACEFQALFEIDRALCWDESFTDPAVRARAAINKAPRRNCAQNGTCSGSDSNYGTPGEGAQDNLDSSEGAQDKNDAHAAGTDSVRSTRHDLESAFSRNRYQVDRDDGEGGEIDEDDDLYVLPIKLSSCPVLIPQIHLYSDGGIDISRDGRYFVTCARVHVPLPVYSRPMGRDAQGRDISTAYRTPPFPQAPRSANFPAISCPTPPPLPVSRVNPRYSASSTGLPVALEDKVVSSRAATAVLASEAPPPLYIAQNMRNIALASSSSSNNNNTGTNSPAMKKSSPAVSVSTSPLMGKAGPAGDTNDIHNSAEKKGDKAPKTRDHSYPDLPEMIAGLSLTDKMTIDGVPVVKDVTRRRVSQQTQLSVTDGMAGIGNGTTSGSAESGTVSDRGEERGAPWPREQMRGAAQESVLQSARHQLIRLSGHYRIQEGFVQEDHLCLFQFAFRPDGSIKTPTLVNSKHLEGALTKAVTSAKLSPTCRYALIGYGVRAGGQVQDHRIRHAACEVVSLSEEHMRSVAVMSDFEDEVNVAQFHPFPGHGIVYGTKRGKVRTFSKS